MFSSRESEPRRGVLPPLIGLLALLCLPRPGSAQTVGMLVNVSGPVQSQRAQQPAHRMFDTDEVHAGDVLSLGRKATATLIFYAAGARYRLPPSSRFQVTSGGLIRRSGGASLPLKPVSRALVSAAGGRSAQPGPRLAGYIAGTVVRGGPEDGPGPHHPSPVGAVRVAPVTLRWQGPAATDDSDAGDARLHLRLLDVDSRQVICDAALPLTTHAYALPAPRLRPGHWYAWSVTLTAADGTAQSCGGPLRVLTLEERGRIAQAERAAAALRRSEPDDPTADLLLAHAYEQQGLYEDAARTCRDALRLAPASRGARAALARLRKLTGEQEEASP